MNILYGNFLVFGSNLHEHMQKDYEEGFGHLMTGIRDVYGEKVQCYYTVLSKLV